MSWARSQLATAMRALGLREGSVVMLHASVRSIGAVHGGPDEIHLAAADAVGSSGMVVMYVGCENGFDDVGRGIFSPTDEAAILEHQPPFDPQVARASRQFGILAEFFRSHPGTICSTNVCARIAARGPQARWMMADQPWNYGFGVGSPLEKLCHLNGRVLLLGSDHDEVTLLHYAEHTAEFTGKRIARYRVPVARDGQRVWVECEEFDTSDRGVHANWPSDFFCRIVDDFIDRHGGTSFCQIGKVGDADSVLLDAAKLVAHAVPIMVRRANGCSAPD